jgi:hypothetical protein
LLSAIFGDRNDLRRKSELVCNWQWHCFSHGDDHGPRPHTPRVATIALHFPAAIRTYLPAHDLVECSSLALCPDAPPALCRSAPIGRASSLPDAASDRLRRWWWLQSTSSADGHARRHLHHHRDRYFQCVNAHHYSDCCRSIAPLISLTVTIADYHAAHLPPCDKIRLRVAGMENHRGTITGGQITGESPGDRRDVFLFVSHPQKPFSRPNSRSTLIFDRSL